MDGPLLLIVLLLAGTVAAFAAGLTPYPFGVLVLSLLLAARFFARAAGRRRNR